MARLMVVIGLMASVLALPGLFHSGLRRLGQPSIISHILAGVVVGPTVLGRVVNLRPLGMEDAGMALDDAIYFLRVVFMFFTGLEMDLCYMRRYLRASLVLACGGSALCLLLAAVGGLFFYGLLHPWKETFYPEGIYASTALFMLVLTSTASPVLIHIVTELKLTGSETGQLAMGTAFANDIVSLTVVSIMDVDWTTYDKDGKAKPPPGGLQVQPIAKPIIFLFLSLNIWIAIRLVVWLVRLLNRAKKGRQYIRRSKQSYKHDTEIYYQGSPSWLHPRGLITGAPPCDTVTIPHLGRPGTGTRRRLPRMPVLLCWHRLHHVSTPDIYEWPKIQVSY
ncbi:hypothetical protein CFC21_001295 [Triticum aestivum]|uniref:Cation/H+ exchanger transmembrane domain-containing protein n=1 Tax=Triticum aestivum TaxID=4565 RepID=A0A3B5XWX9_WHEAT|nr:hypothetical protein CFC21_001295 [Triticum aestivum]